MPEQQRRHRWRLGALVLLAVMFGMALGAVAASAAAAPGRGALPEPAPDVAGAAAPVEPGAQDVPTVTVTAVAPTVTQTAPAPTVTETAPVPTVTATAPAPTVTVTATVAPPTVTASARPVPVVVTETAAVAPAPDTPSAGRYTLSPRRDAGLAREAETVPTGASTGAGALAAALAGAAVALVAVGGVFAASRAVAYLR
jgi:hypothetical protein